MMKEKIHDTNHIMPRSLPVENTNKFTPHTLPVEGIGSIYFALYHLLAVFCEENLDLHLYEFSLNAFREIARTQNIDKNPNNRTVSLSCRQ